MYYNAFIFDLDDTLVNTSLVVSNVMQSWCEENGIDFSIASMASRGRRTQDTVAMVAPHLDATREARVIEEREAAALVVGLQAILGAQALLETLPLERWAIVTSSSLSLAKAKLAQAGLPSPRVIVSADSVKKGKPDPEPYLLAARLLGYEPKSCLAFEDADSGVISALTAGCDVFVIGSACTVQMDRTIGMAANYSELNVLNDGTLGIAHRNV